MCEGVRECARVCEDMRGCAGRGESVRGCARDALIGIAL